MKMRARRWFWSGCLLVFLAGVNSAQAFYNPNSGRWLTRDPIEEEEGENLYLFTRNAPIWLIDIDGRQLAPGMCVICGQPAFGMHKCIPLPPPSDKPCGKHVSRATYPSSKWYRFVDNCATRVCTPHTFIILADGNRLDHGGDGKGEDHWSSSIQTIFIPNSADCAEFSECLKKHYQKAKDKGYSSFGNNCHVAKAAIEECGGSKR